MVHWRLLDILNNLQAFVALNLCLLTKTTRAAMSHSFLSHLCRGYSSISSAATSFKPRAIRADLQVGRLLQLGPSFLQKWIITLGW